MNIMFIFLVILILIYKQQVKFGITMHQQSSWFSSQQIIADFISKLQINRVKAEQKKQEYLQRIMQIFREFVRKSQGQITRIIDRKILKMQSNYQKVLQFLQRQKDTTSEEKGVIVSEFLIKPFERFPFSGNKNEKAFQQQYNLIQKASLLIEQTLVDSFHEEQIPSFENHKFFQTVMNNGIGEQSLTRLSILPQNLSLQPLQDLLPLQKNVRSIKMMGQHLLLIGEDNYIQVWDLQYRICAKKLFLEIVAPVNCLSVVHIGELQCLALGFGDGNPEIWIYRTDSWKGYGCSLSHTRSVTKLVQAHNLLISGSLDGSVCLHSLLPLKLLQSYQHTSAIEDIIYKNNMVYVFFKSSYFCEYELHVLQTGAGLQFRRTLASEYISTIRYTQLGGNFTGIACHIYGLSKIQITRKFRLQESCSISVSQMISDFVVLEAKHTSQYFAICCFQNSSAVRIYSLKRGEAIYQIDPDYMGQSGVAGYLPKMQICWMKDVYWIMVVCQPEFETGNTVRIYKLGL